MLEPIINLDRQFFNIINQSWSNSLFDVVMPVIRNQYTWVPVYLFLLAFVIVNFRSRAMWWILFFLATFALTDLISQQVVKQIFDRPRPCMDAFTSDTARMLIRCSDGFSFVSSHATNHFGLSMFIFQTMKHFGKPWVWLAFVWAALVCYAQVYVGAHFPIDVLGGTLLGCLLGWFTSRKYIQQFGGLKQA
jgi:membrane-associated phospholipid phosphatase